jgi:hypothetical protein
MPTPDTNPDDELREQTDEELYEAIIAQTIHWHIYHAENPLSSKFNRAVTSDVMKNVRGLLKAHDRALLDRVEKEIIGEDNLPIGNSYTAASVIEGKNNLRAEQRQALARWGEDNDEWKRSRYIYDDGVFGYNSNDIYPRDLDSYILELATSLP